MPKRTDIKSILIIGAGPIIIGQACEFDYSGAQACKALREEGYKVILVNSNPATIMTDPNTADITYIEPITWEVVERIIDKERPDAILPTMGGQTALNCALDLFHHGVLEKYKVELIGASPEAIDKAEDRQKFKEAMTKIGLGSAKSGIAHSMEEALQVQADIAALTGSTTSPGIDATLAALVNGYDALVAPRAAVVIGSVSTDLPNNASDAACNMLAGELIADAQLAATAAPSFGGAAVAFMDRGGVLSHGAVVARDLGIPAVVIKGATKSIRAGETLIEADRLAPSEVRCRPVAHELVSDLLRRTRGAPTSCCNRRIW